MIYFVVRRKANTLNDWVICEEDLFDNKGKALQVLGLWDDPNWEYGLVSWEVGSAPNFPSPHEKEVVRYLKDRAQAGDTEAKKLLDKC